MFRTNRLLPSLAMQEKQTQFIHIENVKNFYLVLAQYISFPFVFFFIFFFRKHLNLSKSNVNRTTQHVY